MLKAIGAEEQSGLARETNIEAGCVKVYVIVLDVRVLLGSLATASQEQAICPPHDVGLVDCSDCLATRGVGVPEGKLGHSLRSLLSDQLDALYNTVHNLTRE